MPPKRNLKIRPENATVLGTSTPAPAPAPEGGIMDTIKQAADTVMENVTNKSLGVDTDAMASAVTGVGEDINEYINSVVAKQQEDEDDEGDADAGADADEGFGDENPDEDETAEGVEEDEDEDEDEDDETVVVDEDEDEDEDEDDDEEDGDGEDEDEDEGTSKKKGAKRGVKKSSAVVNAEEVMDYGIDSDDEDDVDFEKFEGDMRDEYLLNFHPEAVAVNFDEVRGLCTVVRDKDGDIIDPFHTTIPIMTKYEKARILGMRAKQLNSNIKPAIPIKDYVIDSYRIAEMELEQKVIPFIIRRPLPSGKSEFWRVNDLMILN